MVAKDQAFIKYCTRSASGTSNSHKRVIPDVMMNFQVPYNENVATHLGIILDSSIQLINKNKVENQALIALRDWLLPLLMNGQVQVG